MFESHSNLATEALASADRLVAAVVYPTENYPMQTFAKLVNWARELELKLAGVVQYPAFEGAGHRCDVVLEDLVSGHRTVLFESRGRQARGCRLDTGALAEATARIEGSLEVGPDLLILNKFGKVECEGGGLRYLIANAIDRDIPVIIGVPDRNLDSWREFVGDFAVEFSSEIEEIRSWMSRLLGTRHLRLSSPMREHLPVD